MTDQQPQAALSSESQSARTLRGIDYLTILYLERRVVVVVIAVCVLLAVIVRFTVPRQYEGVVELAPAEQGSTLATNQTFGALASLGLLGNSGPSSQKEVGLAKLQSRSFLQDFIKRRGLLPILFPDSWNVQTKTWKGLAPTLEEGFNALLGKMTIVPVGNTELDDLHVRWDDRDTAAQVANALVHDLNADFQKKEVDESDKMIAYLYDVYNRTSVAEIRTSVTNLIQDQIKRKIAAQSRNEFVFTVVDPAEPKSKPVSPGLTILGVAAVFLGLLLGVPGAFLWHKLREGGVSPPTNIARLLGLGGWRWRTSLSH